MTSTSQIDFSDLHAGVVALLEETNDPDYDNSSFSIFQLDDSTIVNVNDIYHPRILTFRLDASHHIIGDVHISYDEYKLMRRTHKALQKHARRLQQLKYIRDEAAIQARCIRKPDAIVTNGKWVLQHTVALSPVQAHQMEALQYRWFETLKQFQVNPEGAYAVTLISESKYHVRGIDEALDAMFVRNPTNGGWDTVRQGPGAIRSAPSDEEIRSILYQRGLGEISYTTVVINDDGGLACIVCPENETTPRIRCQRQADGEWHATTMSNT